jgi:hypothetical protein
MARQYTFAPDLKTVEINGFRINLDCNNNYDLFVGKNRDDQIYMAKNPVYIESYGFINETTMLGKTDDPKILEIGILEGGSTIFFDLLYRTPTISCVDMRQDVPAALNKYIKDQRSQNISVHTRIDQADKNILANIVDTDLGGRPDLIIDDASHFYEETKASFECLFPRLSLGGIYVIEDWSWSHSEGAQADDHFWKNKSSLTNLIFEIIMISGSDLSAISRLMFLPGMAVIERGPGVLPEYGWELDTKQMLRGQSLPLV